MTAIPIVALDVADRSAALAMVDRLGERCRFYKVGSELFTAEGPRVVAELRDRGCDVFLDIKLHDIPNTVRAGVRSAARLGARLVTVHAAGGRAMLEAAREGGGADCGVLAVTVLTSLDAAELAEGWGRERVVVADEVLRLAGLAETAGVHGVVCSGLEVGAVAARHPGLAPLVPGLRMTAGAAEDQKRVVTPAMAAAAGARYLVLGRAVTAAADPAAAFGAVLATLDGGGAGRSGA